MLKITSLDTEFHVNLRYFRSTNFDVNFPCRDGSDFNRISIIFLTSKLYFGPPCRTGMEPSLIFISICLQALFRIPMYVKPRHGGGNRTLSNWSPDVR